MTLPDYGVEAEDLHCCIEYGCIDCPICAGPTVLFTRRGDGSRRYVCSREFGCMGEIVVTKDGKMLIGGDGFL